MCVDFIKGKCARDTCKYFHPPEHLIAQLKKQKIANNAAVAAVLNAANNYNIYQQQQQQQPPPNLQFNPFLGLTTTSSPPIHLQTMPMTSTPHFAHLHAQLRQQAPMHLLGSSQSHLRSNLNFHGTTNNSSRFEGQNAAFLNSFTSSHLNNMSNLNNGAYLMNPLQQQQQHLTDLQMVNLLNRNNFNNNSIKTTLNNNNNNYNTSSLVKTSNVSPNSSAISNTTNNIGNNNNNNNNSNTQQAPSNFNAQLSAPAITAASATANAAATAVGTNNSLVGRRSKQKYNLLIFGVKPWGSNLNRKINKSGFLKDENTCVSSIIFILSL